MFEKKDEGEITKSNILEKKEQIMTSLKGFVSQTIQKIKDSKENKVPQVDERANWTQEQKHQYNIRKIE